MAEWAYEREWPNRPYGPYNNGSYQQYKYYQQYPGMPQQPYESQAQPFASTSQKGQLSPIFPAPGSMQPPDRNVVPIARGDNPREIRNKAEKQRRDKLNQSISELAAMVPPVVSSSRKIDKTGILRLTAHYLRAHQYVFGDTITHTSQDMSGSSAQAVLQFLNGFLLTTTYRGIIVVVSQNVQQYLGYTELDLLGQNIFTIIHKDDQKILRDQLMPRTQNLGPNGELLIPDGPEGKAMVARSLAGEKRSFIIRFKKHSQRTDPAQYVSCHMEGSLRKSDKACRGYNRCCQMVRRARARGDNPCASGNDIVFIGIVRPVSNTFKKESELEHFRMEYRTRHSIDGEIIQCEQRIALVTGYMTDEVNGLNAMNFMHRDDVRWVIIALREMYDQHRVYGESCYRLMMKNGQFIYMRTRGCLEVDSSTKAVTSFICTNTVMNDTDGQHLNRLMKKKFTLLVNNNEDPPIEPEVSDPNDHSLPVEDPRQLEKVILHLVTNLPSPQPEEKDRSLSPERGDRPYVHLAIIPPRRERIVSAIERIYGVIKTLVPRNDRNKSDNRKRSMSAVRIVEVPEENRVYEQTVNTVIQTAPTGTLPKISTIGNFGRRQPNLESFGNAFPQVGTTPPSVEEITSNVAEKVTFAEYIANRPNKNSKFNFTLSSKVDDECQIVDLDAPGTSTCSSGTKRPNEHEAMYDTLFKKKVTPADQNVEEPLVDVPELDFFGDAIGEIDAALISLENNMDPNFPGLLIDQDIQDILGELEAPEDPKKNIPDN